MENYTVREIKPHVTLIDDTTGSSSWLITGEKEALLVDTGWGDEDILNVVRELTDLPVSLFVTHAHIDHYRHTASFEKAYIHRTDWELLPEYSRVFDRSVPSQSRLIPVDEGFTFDLGDARATVYLAAGHTAGSAVIVVPEYECVCTGDAFGSGVGVWMQVPMCLTIREYKDALSHYLDKCAFTGAYTYCGGHFNQGEHNPLCYALVEDMHTLCTLLLSGDDKAADVRPSDTNRFTPEQGCSASYKRAGMEFLKSRLN